MPGAMGAAASAAAAAAANLPAAGPLGPVFDPTAFRKWWQDIFVQARQAGLRERQRAGAASAWRIRRPGMGGSPGTVGKPFGTGTVLGGDFPAYYGRTVLGG